MREGRLAVRRYNSYHMVQKAEKIELPMVSPTFSVLFIIILNTETKQSHICCHFCHALTTCNTL